MHVDYTEFERAMLKKSTVDSLTGPSRGAPGYTVYIITLITMIACGSSNDFLGKLLYQMYPGSDDGLEGFKNNYWITILLTGGSFFICSFALIFKSARPSYRKLRESPDLLYKICIPSAMDFLVTGGRYIGLIFLPAAAISILKNGAQLLFLALIRRFIHGKNIKLFQNVGIFITVVGLGIVSLENVVSAQTDEEEEGGDEADEAEAVEYILIGIGIMLFVGLLGAIRNDIEEILLKQYDLDAMFVVGFESIISLSVTLIFSLIMFITDPFDNIDKANVSSNIYDGLLTEPYIMLIFLLFLVAIFGKDTMQMELTKLSSALTRKLYQQIYPSGTWIISMTVYYVTGQDDLGEGWKPYSYLRVFGFAIVLFGNWLYIKGKGLSDWISGKVRTLITGKKMSQKENMNGSLLTPQSNDKMEPSVSFYQAVRDEPLIANDESLKN